MTCQRRRTADEPSPSRLRGRLGHDGFRRPFRRPRGTEPPAPFVDEIDHERIRPRHVRRDDRKGRVHGLSKRDVGQPLRPAAAYVFGHTVSRPPPSERTPETCDRRLKVDLSPAGESANGLSLYDFRYIGGDELFRGVMAQDLLADPRFADAVASEGGYYRVDYARLGLAPLVTARCVSPARAPWPWARGHRNHRVCRKLCGAVPEAVTRSVGRTARSHVPRGDP